jgi:phytoene dehydrogenase-like protein
MLGWETTPRNSGSRRPQIETPVNGLYLAGHWTQPGAGSLRVLVSGVMAAQHVLSRVAAEPFEIPLAIASSWKPEGEPNRT